METSQIPDPELPVGKEPGKSKIWLPCGCMVAALLLIVVMPAVFLLTWNHDNARKVEQRLATIRSAGQPTTNFELDLFYEKPPAASDATQLWLEGMQLVPEDRVPEFAKKLPLFGDGTVVPPGEPWPQLPEAEKLLTLFAPALEKFHSAAKLGGVSRYPLNFPAGIEMRLDHAQHLRTATRLLCLEALVRGHQGDAAGCAESIRAGFATRRSLEREPVIVSQLVAVALQNLTLQTFADTLATVRFSDDDLRSLQDEIRSFDSRASLQRAFIGERVFGCEYYARGSVVAQNKRIPFVSSDFALYLELYEGIIAALDQDFPECLAAGATFEQRVKKEAASPVKKFGHIVTLLMIPAMSAALDASARITAESASAHTAIAVEFYRRKHERLPQSLDELVPEFLPNVPRDPYDGKPLKYIRADDHYLIYSIGRDRKDDGGDRSDARRDAVFYVPLRQK